MLLYERLSSHSHEFAPQCEANPLAQLRPLGESFLPYCISIATYDSPNSAKLSNLYPYVTFQSEVEENNCRGVIYHALHRITYHIGLQSSPGRDKSRPYTLILNIYTPT